MAIAGIMLGTVTGFLSAITSYIFLGLSFWASLLVYSGIGTFTALLVILALVARQPATGASLHQPVET